MKQGNSLICKIEPVALFLRLRIKKGDHYGKVQFFKALCRTGYAQIYYEREKFIGTRSDKLFD